MFCVFIFPPLHYDLLGRKKKSDLLVSKKRNTPTIKLYNEYNNSQLQEYPLMRAVIAHDTFYMLDFLWHLYTTDNTHLSMTLPCYTNISF